MTAPLASLSLDLDNKWSYLKTHGDRGWDSFPSYLDRVVPQVLAMLDRLDTTITVFVVGRDAALPQNHDALAAIAVAGHEIGNHSFHHEPWLQQYSADEIKRELADAEEVIERATGAVPRGFRGPGFSFSPELLHCLASRGYDYDASTFPTFLGPLARAYYFFKAQLDDEMRAQRKNLFGGIREGFRPLRPYRWRFAGNEKLSLLELPVTTLPFIRAPLHVSYLLYLATFSQTLAWAYWRTAMADCRMFGVAPSLLLHPLDFLGGDEEPDLDFFPAMRTAGEKKREFVRAILQDYTSRYRVVPMRDHAVAALSQIKLPEVLLPVSYCEQTPRTTIEPMEALR